MVDADSLTRDREIGRDDWLREVVPQWGAWLHREIEATRVGRGTVALWWLAGPSWCLKTPAGSTFLIDPYAGPSICTASPPTRWIRMAPLIFDPWGFRALDALFATHHHHDHCDFYTVRGTAETTGCLYVGPLSAANKLRGMGVAANRIRQVAPGDTIDIKNETIRVLPAFDELARRTWPDNETHPHAESSVSYLFHAGAAGILFLGDSIYSPELAEIRRSYRVDAVVLSLGRDLPGSEHRMYLSAAEALLTAEAVGARQVIPGHYDLWQSTATDPSELRDLARGRSDIEVLLPAWGERVVIGGG